MHAWLVFLSFSITASAAPQGNDTPAECEAVPSFHELDFWVGRWDVYVDDAKVGDNRIEKTLERWRSGETP